MGPGWSRVPPRRRRRRTHESFFYFHQPLFSSGSSVVAVVAAAAAAAASNAADDTADTASAGVVAAAAAAAVAAAAADPCFAKEDAQILLVGSASGPPSVFSQVRPLLALVLAGEAGDGCGAGSEGGKRAPHCPKCCSKHSSKRDLPEITRQISRLQMLHGGQVRPARGTWRLQRLHGLACIG